MSTLHRAVIRAYTAGTHKADVQLVESLPTHLITVPVATDIPPAEVQAGRECAVLLVDDNPDNGVIVTVHGAVPAAPAGGSSIADADGNTYVRTEQNANEDKVRAGVGGTERLLLQTTSPHLTITGEAKIGGTNSKHSIGGATIITDTTLTVRMPSTNPGTGQFVGVSVGGAGNPSAATGDQVIGVAGNPVVNVAASSTGIIVDALNFYAALFGGSGATVGTLRGAVLFPVYMNSFSGTLTLAQGIALQPPAITASPSAVITTVVGVDAYNQGHARVQTAYHFRSQEMSGATVAMQPYRDEGSPAGNAHGNRFLSNTQFASLTGAFGTGAGVIGIANATTVPTTNPAGGGVLYASAGALVWRGSAGTVTVIAPA